MDATGYGDFRARREATIWQRMNHVLRVLLFVALVAAHRQFLSAALQETAIRIAPRWTTPGAIDRAEALLARQTKEVTLLKTDPTYLETIARDRLDLMKEGETIFRLETRRAGSQLPAKPQP